MSYRKSTHEELLLQHITSGNFKKVKKLITNGANVHNKDKGGRGYLQVASLHGHKKIVKLLLNMNDSNAVSVNDKTESGNTALHLACSRGHKATIKSLLRAGADTKEINNNANTALHLIVDCGGSNVDIVDIIEILIDNGANVDSKNSLGNTPLHHAAKNGNKAAVKSLIARGASTNEKNGAGRTPLVYCKKQTIKILLNNGNDPDSSEESNDTSKCEEEQIIEDRLKHPKLINDKCPKIPVKKNHVGVEEQTDIDSPSNPGPKPKNKKYSEAHVGKKNPNKSESPVYCLKKNHIRMMVGIYTSHANI